MSSIVYNPNASRRHHVRHQRSPMEPDPLTLESAGMVFAIILAATIVFMMLAHVYTMGSGYLFHNNGRIERQDSADVASSQSMVAENRSLT